MSDNEELSDATQMNRTVGGEDGTVDALFQFTRPVSGNLFWCPPMKGDALDLDYFGA